MVTIGFDKREPLNGNRFCGRNKKTAPSTGAAVTSVERETYAASVASAYTLTLYRVLLLCSNFTTPSMRE